MEGLPPTSNTKMIDMWLILCQLVPFAQVVLLTIKEYLIEDEKVSMENDDIQPTTPDITLEDESNPKEDWVSSLKELLKAGSITMLTMIGGNILTKFKILLSGSLSREKNGVTDCAFCCNCLLLPQVFILNNVRFDVV